jgi:hypothetical protein
VNALPTSAMTRPYGKRNRTVRTTAQVSASVPLDAAWPMRSSPTMTATVKNTMSKRPRVLTRCCFCSTAYAVSVADDGCVLTGRPYGRRSPRVVGPVDELHARGLDTAASPYLDYYSILRNRFFYARTV